MKEATELVFYEMRERLFALPYPSVIAKGSVLFHTLFHKTVRTIPINLQLTLVSSYLSISCITC